MNHVTIHQSSDFQAIINSLIFIAENQNLQNQETSSNMWAISIDSSSIDKLSLKDFTEFISSLLHNRQEQVTQLNIQHKVVFYMWFDEMAAQLRFNIISYSEDKLPFGCQVEIISSAEPILKDFFSSRYHDGIPWSELESLENMANDEEDDNPYVLQVFTSFLN